MTQQTKPQPATAPRPRAGVDQSTPHPTPETIPAAAYQQVLDLLACPACLGALRATPSTLACEECSRLYPVLDDIPILLIDRATRPAQPR